METHDLSDLWPLIRQHLSDKGIALETLGSGEPCEGGGGVKVVCVSAKLGESLEELGRSPRDQVVMVRVNEETMKSLDSWVQTGAVKSRSEAAALFIREGLRLRATELSDLEGVLRDVDQAKKRLREAARRVLGTESEAQDEEG
jgi:Arc/MetJ-type ribon-helix-helix transcriptional regulator